MTKVSPNNGHETKSDILPSDIFKFDTDHIFLYQRLLKYFNDFQNQNFSVWTQTMELKQNQTFSVGHNQIILKYFNDFYN